MSAATTVERTEHEEYQAPLFTIEHKKVVGETVFVCVQEDCDGVHHFWCSCRS